MNQTPLKWFEDHRLIAVIRSGSAEDAEKMIKAASEGGFRIFEISLQTPQAIRLLENYSKKEDFLIGAGSVMDGEMAQRAINAGAKYITSCFTDDAVVAVARHNDVIAIPGAATPTEVFNAYQYGAELVKIYPAALMGGVSYLKSLRARIPFMKYVVESGVTLENAFDYLKFSPAVCVGAGLFDKSLVRSDSWSEITERARQFSLKLESLRVTRS